MAFHWKSGCLEADPVFELPKFLRLGEVAMAFGARRLTGAYRQRHPLIATVMSRYVSESCDHTDDPELLAACISWMDAVEMDPDLEDSDEDCCSAYDDYSGKRIDPESFGIRAECGSEDDAEDITDELYRDDADWMTCNVRFGDASTRSLSHGPV